MIGIAAIRSRIGLRLALLAAGTLFIAIAVGGAITVRIVESAYREEARTRAAALLGTLSVPCAITVAMHALDQLDGYLTEVTRVGGEHMHVLAVAMLDADSHVLARSETGTFTELRAAARAELDADFARRAVQSPDALWREQVSPEGKRLLLVSMPTVSGLRWGTLVAAFDLGDLDRQLSELKFLLTGLALGLAGALGLLLYVGLSRLVVRPVRALATAAELIARGQLQARTGLQRGDELGRLAQVFDAMASEIELSTQALEQKVQERTAEVEKKSRELADVNAALHSANTELARLASTDALTNVKNRRHFSTTIERRITPQQTGTTTLLMFDVDHFKALNDRLGHPVGDLILRDIAHILQVGLRTTDTLSRYGGEEFAAILVDTDAIQGLEIAERIRSAVATYDFDHSTGHPVGPMTVSVGLANCPQDAQDYEQLIARSDQALYQAKARGRNRVERFVAATS